MMLSSIRGAGFLVCLFVFLLPAAAGTTDDVGIARMALCQDSWADWQKASPDKLKAMAARINAGFSHKDNDPFAVPKAPVTIAGLGVLQLYPESVGMAVGFSVLVDAPFDKARAVFERMLGKRLRRCESSDGMKSCELEIADKRTFMLMTEDGAEKPATLVGCYYYYEK